jgi:cytochrome c peroxidase
VGLRRSQALEGGASSRGPFHWSGDLATFDDLFGEVMMKRMALPVTPPAESIAALAGWMDTIPALAPAEGLDPALVARGEALFFDPELRCDKCHSGPTFSDDQMWDVGTGGEFVTPSLLGVGLRAPLMHDGCARDLKARFGVCGGSAHGDVSLLPASDIDALVAYLKTL